jgi:hypothetical protein
MGGNSKWTQPSLHSRALIMTLLVAALTGIGCSGDASADPRLPRPSSGALIPGSAQPSPGADSTTGVPRSPSALGGLAGADGSGEKICAEGISNTSPITPTVWLVIDGSGSMADEFGGSTRWESLRSALMDPDGVVSTLQQFVRFGMVIYSGAEQQVMACNAPAMVNFVCGCYTGAEAACCTAACGGTPPPAPMCAELVVVDPLVSNFTALDAAYPAHEIGGWTPTDRALEHVVTALPVLNGPVTPDQKKDPIYVILATDGAPNDQCDGGANGGAGGGSSGFQPHVAQRVVDTTTAGVQKGMNMFVISLAGNDPELRTHLDQVANIGQPGQKPFEPATKDELVAALQQIIGGATCQIDLNGAVVAGQECSGKVQLNGVELPCDQADGYRLVDERTVQLQGSACTNFLGVASQVYAAFPCSVFRPD